MKGKKMPLHVYSDHPNWYDSKMYLNSKDYLDWLSSLQPCEISESELTKISNHVLTRFNKDSPINITDIVEERELRTETKSGSWTDYELVFKQPKSEETNEAVEFADYKKWFFEEQERADKLRMDLEIQSQTIIIQRFRIEELEKENRHLAYQTSIYLDEMRKMKSDETPNFKEDA